MNESLFTIKLYVVTVGLTYTEGRIYDVAVASSFFLN